MSSAKPLIGITTGDPAGIGPEITARALAVQEIYRLCRPLVVGDAGVLREAVRFSELALEVRGCAAPEEPEYRFGTVDVLDLRNVDMKGLRYKTVAASSGAAAFEYIAEAIRLALAVRIDAVVTGPIHKEALNLAGHRYAGHTEIFADLTGAEDTAMMLADGGFRVSHVTGHTALRDVFDRITKERVLRVVELSHQALRRLGIEAPRIAVAGLNPHAGEGGLFGREEIEEIAPAVKAAGEAGMDVEGPLPADTVFSKMAGGRYDLVVAMYHDQGHIPAKLSGFSYDAGSDTWRSVSGVNVTLGLPIVRTSVDHGVAFDRAGEARANPQSMIQAVSMAARLACGA